MTGLRLHPVLFESKATVGSKQSDHSHPGEAKAGDFAMQKFRTFLWGKPFTWIADCSSLKTFFDQRNMPNHQMERLRMRMLCFQFTIVHRNANMVKEVDLLTRYNKFAQEFCEDTAKTPVAIITSSMSAQYNRPIGSTNIPLTFVGPTLAPRTEAAKRWLKEMVIVLGTVGVGEIEKAIQMTGHEPVVTMAAEEHPTLNKLAEQRLGQVVNDSVEDMLYTLAQTTTDGLPIDSYVATCNNSEEGRTQKWLDTHLNAITTISATSELKTAVLFFTEPTPQPPAAIKKFHTMLQFEGWKTTFWKLKNIKCGGAMANTYWAMILTTNTIRKHLQPPQTDSEAEVAMAPRLKTQDFKDDDLCMDVVDTRTPRDSGIPSPTKPRA